MTKPMPELLAPAGGPAEFNAALAAGADAIYCGFGNTFNARRGAQNFDSTTFEQACRRAHIVGAKVYVTVNVVIRDDELMVALALVRRAWLLGADAFIIQDWGLLAEVQRRWPHIECHVSTQANVHDARAVAWCASLGAKRVTLSRELSIPEIARIAREGVDLECFCHGAICICYSGVCCMSSCAGSRSANRGTCAQPCRLPYELVDAKGMRISQEDWGRPLCPKDFYSFDDLSNMAEAGVCSLKVEGRLKGPDYIASVIAAYRAQLDDLSCGIEPTPANLEERRTKLKRVFNRDFTSAYLHGTSGNELMSYERSNNRGELVGEVVATRSYGKTKVRRGGAGGGRERLRTVGVAEVDVVLSKSVDKGDLLEIRPLSDPSQFLTATASNDAAVGETITCRTSRTQEVGSPVRVIRSRRAMELGERTASMDVPRKRPVMVKIRARLGEPFAVVLQTTNKAVRVVACGSVVEEARTRQVTRDDLIKHVGRMGSTFFEPASYEVILDEGCGMSFSEVHAVRAHACEELERAILKPYAERTLEDVGPSRTLLGSLSSYARPANQELEVCAVVPSIRLAHVARKAGAARVYVCVDGAVQGQWPEWAVPVLDEVCREGDHGRLDPWISSARPVAVGNVSELALAKEHGALAEVLASIPVHNRSCLQTLVKAGATGAWLSPELSLQEIQGIGGGSPVPLGIMVLGRVRAMTTEHCVLQVANKCAHNCAACKLQKQPTYLKDDKGNLFPVTTDLQGRSRVYAAQPLDNTPYVPELVAAGVTRFAADCTLLEAQDVVKAVRAVCDAVESALQGRASRKQMSEHTSGHLFAPIK